MLEVIEDMRRRAATPPSPPRPGGDVWGRFRMLNRSGAAIHVISRKRCFGFLIAGGLYSVTALMVEGEHFTMITRSGILFCVDCGWAWFGILGFVSHRWISYCGCSSHQWDQLLKLPRVLCLLQEYGAYVLYSFHVWRTKQQGNPHKREQKSEGSLRGACSGMGH
jgi:hypothetical protein